MKLSTRIMAALVLALLPGCCLAQTGPNLPKRGLPPSALFL